MVAKSEKTKPSKKRVCRPRSRSIIDTGIEQMQHGFNPNALPLQRLPGYQIGNESFLGFEKRSSVRHKLSKDEIDSPEDVRLIRYVKMNNERDNNKTEMAEDCETVTTNFPLGAEILIMYRRKHISNKCMKSNLFAIFRLAPRESILTPGRHVSTVRGPQLGDEGEGRQALWSNSERTVG